MSAMAPIVGPMLPHEAAAAPQLDEALASLLPGVQADFLWQASRYPSFRLLIERAMTCKHHVSELLDELQLSANW